MTIRPLHTIPEFRAVVALEREIWGYDDPEDAVGLPIFVVTVKRGGILLGAYDGEHLAAFVYSLAGLRSAVPIQWSHMLGVRAEYRGTGLGRQLKLAQRRAAIDMGIDLMEWTFDPLQAVNAHLNFRRLGVVVEEYHENVYGESSSPLHRGNPTDRFIAQWWLRSARVEAVIEGSGIGGWPVHASDALGAVSSATERRHAPGRLGQGPGPGSVADTGVPVVLTAARRGESVEPVRLELGRSDDRLDVAIPAGFTEMLGRDDGLAHAWRVATRDVFTHYLAAGYRVTWFDLGPEPDQGRYRLERRPPA